ncbi:uncharacterized protein cfap92 [Tachysurus vachellii]|uniref:uncharacterized protein cfap92 n=1 Tax=Tachysurus vachellii TaxID=175792 RepID=UPI00296B3857|nr:uncharacterized protein cfap92 [Tachysurus vachellii]XP_060713809.1 uncharacterized protein cfap92 [Tachysurus vachellii]
MESGTSKTSVDQMNSNSYDDWQSSNKQETYDGNNDIDDNAVHNSESKDTEPEPTGPCPQITDSYLECNADSSYTVTCTVSMVLAVPKGYEDDPVLAENERQLRKSQSKSIIEAAKAQAYYHIEYKLLPDNSEPIKVDLVMFGLVAKVYMDNETKMLKPWRQGDLLWLGWSQSVKLKVTRELLIKMSSHKVTFRVWDTKDRVSPKAKYDRPKAFRLLQGRRVEDPEQRGTSLDCELESAGGIKGMVYKLQALYEKQNPASTTSKKWQKYAISTDYQQTSKLKCDTDDPSFPTMEASEKPLLSAVLNTGGLLEQRATFSNQSYGGKQKPQTADPKIITSEATADQEKDTALSTLAQKPSLDPCSTSMKSGTLKDNSLLVSKKKHAYKTDQERTAEEDMGKNEVALAELRTVHFLAGETSLTDCLMICCRKVFKVLCSIILDQPLMSEELKAELNPLIITISSASSLPSTPVPFYELEQKCMPVYCQYKFHNMPAYRTKGLSHGSNIYFKDVNVILTGLLSTEELHEFLRGPPLEIEIHDRDRKVKEPSSSPAIFGTKATDDKLASTALVHTKQTIYSSFEEKRKPCDPFGIAKLNLSDLLRGHRCLKLSLPIRGYHPVQWLGTEKQEWGDNEPEKTDAQNQAMPNGHYLQANSELKVQVEIAHPFNPDPDKSEGHCALGRIIYIFKYNNITFLERLRSEILKVNAVAFQLHGYNEEVAQRILQGHIMDATERENKYLNALTGFHFMDKSVHLFVLEGLKDEAIKKLWETVHIKLMEDVEKQVTVLYNSGLSFSKRLYDTLDVGLRPIHLYNPLEIIMRQPLLYIRDTVPHTCLQAMLRISHLCQVSKLEEVIQYNLFPSAEMVQNLGKEFGIIPSRGVEQLMADSSEAKDILHPRVSRRRTYTPLDIFNKDYVEWKLKSQANQELCTKNFIQANIEDIRIARSALQTLKPKVFVAKVDDGQSAYNYSIQTMNSTSLAKGLLYKEMAKEPARRFTYSQDYHSFTVDPVDVEAEHKTSEARSRAAWLTYSGFILHNIKDATESNKHPKNPEEARVEELKKPWRENILHENILKPVLNRNRWPWSKRHKDFELYRRPPAVFSPETPITIHLAGEALHQEQLQAAHAQYVKWLSKILPDKESSSCGRVSEFKCYMRRAGLDKLHDILKDKPMKLSLRAWNKSLPMPYTDTMKEDKLECLHSSDTQTNRRLASELSKCQFGRYWRSHSFQHKRNAQPLTEEEKSLHVFHAPQNTTNMYTDLSNTQHKRNVIEMKTCNSVAVFIK